MGAHLTGRLTGGIKRVELPYIEEGETSGKRA